jgi:NAD(P)-dependent dehydrogenase (short-subunit alcohol dehydrogenase family)
LAAYASSKAAVVHLVECFAKEWGKHKIRVNSVAPGTVPTEMSNVYLKDPAIAERMIQATPLKKLAEAEDIANMVAFLASDAASMITGQDVTIDGGFTL